jgi:L-seryl-tRNA(Ser) seleniumtransferase
MTHKTDPPATTSDRGRFHPPSIERVLAAARPELGDRDPEAVLVVAREVVDAERARLMVDGREARRATDLGARLIDRLRSFDGAAGDAADEREPGTVINATGVLVHTNLGRATWPRAAIDAARRATTGPLLLEMDRATGRRGPRLRIAEEHLVALTGAEAALVVTNNAAAVALAVGLAGRGGAVAVSRGELVEIGGGVRIPEILRRAGVHLVEVGTTNRTRVADFGAVFDEGRRPIRVVLRVHPSNFVQSGFVEAPDARELASLAHERGAIVVDDLGSGALLPTERVGLAHEPTPREWLAAGADVVTFSGDKLVGGPQAGLIVGRADLVARLRRDPLARAMRPDKSILAAVAATLALYRGGRATAEIPVWRMLFVSVDELRRRADAITAALADADLRVIDTQATVGGGSLPGEQIPSVGLAIDAGTGRGTAELLARLRAGEPAVISRIDHDRVVLDLRTVEPGDDGTLVTALRAALAG